MNVQTIIVWQFVWIYKKTDIQMRIFNRFYISDDQIFDLQKSGRPEKPIEKVVQRRTRADETSRRTGQIFKMDFQHFELS